MKRKIFAMLLSAAMLLSVAACSSSTAEEESAAGDSGTEVSTDTNGFDYYSDYPQDISGEIEFYQQKPEIEEYMYEVIDEFQKLYPNITVTQNVQNDAASNLQTRAAAGDFTDVWLYWPTDMV